MSTVYFDDPVVEFQLLDGFRQFSFRHMALGDIDPIYTMIRNADMTDDEKKRMMFAHLMVYDLKSSIALADVKDDNMFYDNVKTLFETGKVGKDRKDVASRETNVKSRTFGTMIPKMKTKSPEEWVQQAIDETINTKSWGSSLKASQNIPTFGEYFGFKLADMIETIFDIKDYNVRWGKEFHDSLPRGALTGFEMVRTGSTHKFRSKEEIRKCPLMVKFFEQEAEFFSEYACPQHETRRIGVQEIETFLCDYRKFKKGTLKPGDKVLKLKEGIDHNINLETATKLYVGAEPLLKRRKELLDLGINDINEIHCNRFVG